MKATLGLLQRIWHLALLFTFPAGCAVTNAQHYQLLEGSTFLDDCAVCDRLSIAYPMRGEFDLVLLSENSLFSRYSVTNVHFFAGPSAQPVFKLAGDGEMQIGGEVALLQQWQLKLAITPRASTNEIVLTNSTKTVDRAFPNLSVSCVESNGSFISTVRMEIKAAPVEEIWFLARKPVGLLRAGDILSSSGRLVKSQTELLAEIGITNPPPGLTLDALDIRNGYRFSVSESFANTAFGPVEEGDFFSRGFKILSAEQWMAAFGIPSDVPDPGFDAVHFLDWGDARPVDLLFSTRKPVFSPKLNRTLGRGDLLAVSYDFPLGASVRRTNAELLAKFHPPDPKHDYGLDGVYLWWRGETWFSLEEGFVDSQLGAISEGDLLSDAGYIIFRNADLLRNFSVDAESDFGLRDFFVVTQAGYPATSWVLNPLQLDRVSGDASLSWRPSLASGPVVQVERAPHFGLPFEPISPVITETQWTDHGTLKTNRSGIYRLREFR
jgi:hypothetical protein